MIQRRRLCAKKMWPKCWPKKGLLNFFLLYWVFYFFGRSLTDFEPTLSSVKFLFRNFKVPTFQIYVRIVDICMCRKIFTGQKESFRDKLHITGTYSWYLRYPFSWIRIKKSIVIPQLPAIRFSATFAGMLFRCAKWPPNSVIRQPQFFTFDVSCWK